MPASDCVVVGLARGGVEVAAPVAARIGCPLDALVVRKVSDRWQPELAIGAVTPHSIYWCDGVPRDRTRLESAAEAHARAVELDHTIHASARSLALAGTTCILVDDGIATGATMIAALRWARRAGAWRLIVAVPVASTSSLGLIEPEADRIVCPLPVAQLRAVGWWYQDFDQVDDARVVQLLVEARRRQPDPTELE